MKKKMYIKSLLLAICILAMTITGCGAADAADNGDLKETENQIQTEAESEEMTKAADEKDAQQSVDGEQTASDKDGAARGESTPLEEHGRLSVRGTQLVDADKEAFQIKGVSTHGLMWFPQYVNEETFRTLRDDWQVNCIRLAMYTAEGGYCTGSDQEEMKELVDEGVSYATELGMYVIIDWHILSDGDPNTYKSEAKEFWQEISLKYRDYDNVLYEICNEPNGNVSWSQVKSYAEEVIPLIRANDEDAVIIVGTPTWSQDVDEAAKDPVTGYDNIMYALHFYADTHKDDLRKKMTRALDKGLPVFCSEFGITDASGNGNVNETEADKWIELMDEKGVSYCIWSLSNKDESSALIKAGCDKVSDWQESELSTEALWYIRTLGGSSTIKDEGVSQESGEAKNTDDAGNESDAKYEEKVTDTNDITVTISETNSWSDSVKDYKQLSITLTNKGDAVTSWQVEAELDGEYEVDQSWGGNFTISGRKMKISNADYNGNLGEGQTLSDIGVIIKTK